MMAAVPGRRVVLVVTGLAVAAAAAAFALVGRAHIESLAAVLTVLVSMAGLGVAVWAGWPARAHGRTSVRVSGTGSVHRSGRGSSIAVTGVDIADGPVPAEVVIESSGDVEGGGDAVTGYRHR